MCELLNCRILEKQTIVVDVNIYRYYYDVRRRVGDFLIKTRVYVYLLLKQRPRRSRSQIFRSENTSYYYFCY